MPSASQIEKSQLRRIVRDRLNLLTPALRVTASAKLCQQLRQQDFFRQAILPLFFAPLPGEIDLWPLLEETVAASRPIALPRYNHDTQVYDACLIENIARDLIIGPYELDEPSPACPTIPLSKFDLILVPGVAFDPQGHRLGRGKGYYDRLLAQTRGHKCGVGFEEQLLPEIPAEPHDIRMNTVILPNQCLKIG
jgi:5-formyltetrahydrofolate cyclo-ligase